MSNHQAQDPDKAIREALLENMSVILSPFDADRRVLCEERIKMLQVTETFALDMIEISHDIELEFALRQLALVILKQYVTIHWKTTSNNFTQPETPAHVKEQVKNTLIQSLGSPGTYQSQRQQQHLYNNQNNSRQNSTNESDSSVNNKDKRLRTCMAAVITNIAVFDWPEEWPNLLEVLTSYLCSSDRLVIYGAMKVFVELSRDITEQQLPHIVPIILPKMYDIFIQPSLYPVGTRCRALRIFSNLCESFEFIYEGDKNAGASARKTYLEPILPKVIEALIEGLQMPTNMTDDQGRTFVVVNLELNYEIMNCLYILMNVAKKVMLKLLDHLLPVIWNILTKTAAMYLTYVVNSDTNTDPDVSGNDLEIGEEEEESSLCRLVRSIISFVQQLVENSKLRKKYIKGNITDVMYYIIVYMLITDEQMHLWKEDPDQFIIDEDEDSFSNTIRNATFELITAFGDEFCEENEQQEAGKSKPDALWFWLSVMDAIKRHFNELAQCRTDITESACTKRWKLQETCLMALCHGPESFISIIQSNTSEAQSLSSDLMFILKTVLQNASDNYPFLTGRVLITSSKFAAIMHDDEVKRFLQATCNGLCNESDVIKICAIRSTQAFCQYLHSAQRIHLMKPIMLNVLNRLVDIGMNYFKDVLSVVLDAILTMINADKEFASTAESVVAPLVISSLVKSGQNPAILMVIEEILDELFKIKECYGPLHDRLIPTLLDILARDPQNYDKSSSTTSLVSLQPATLDILRTMIVESPVPISESMIHKIFPSAVNCILSTRDDSAIIQSGGELLRGFISKSVDQVAAYKFHGTDQNGIAAVLRVCLHILDPKTSENCAMFISRLVSVFIRKACHYLSEDDKQLLLRSVLTKLQSADALIIVQSILLIFAHLINFDHKAIINFLSQLPAPSGTQSAFEFVIIQWLSRQQLFYGHYDQRVTLFALCTLMENSFQLLNSTMVPDDGTTNENQHGSQAVITRSKSKQSQNPTNWTVIPASIKIIKIMLHEYWEALHLERGSSYDSSDCSTLDADEEEGDEWKDVDHDDSHTSTEVDITEVNENESKLSQSTKCNKTSGFSRSFNNADAKDNSVVLGNSKNNDDLFRCVSYSYADSDDVDVLNDPINSISLKDTLVSFLKRFKNSPYVTSFLPHLNDNEKSILHDISEL